MCKSVYACPCVYICNLHLRVCVYTYSGVNTCVFILLSLVCLSPSRVPTVPGKWSFYQSGSMLSISTEKAEYNDLVTQVSEGETEKVTEVPQRKHLQEEPAPEPRHKKKRVPVAGSRSSKGRPRALREGRLPAVLRLQEDTVSWLLEAKTAQQPEQREAGTKCCQGASCGDIGRTAVGGSAVCPSITKPSEWEREGWDRQTIA